MSDLPLQGVVGKKPGGEGILQARVVIAIYFTFLTRIAQVFQPGRRPIG